jgi:outer membrane protein TolC
LKKGKMMRVRVILLVIVTVALLSQGTAAATEEKTSIPRLSLQEAQDYAVKHSTATQNARLDVKMARKKIWETTTMGLPQVTANVSYRNNLSIVTTLIPAKFFDSEAGEDEFEPVKFGTQHNAVIEISASQLIFSGSYFVGLQASQIYLRLSREQLIKSEIDVKETVTNTYYLILLAEDNKKTLESSLQNVKRTLFETKELHNAGFAQDTDVDQIQLSMTDLENAVRAIGRQIEITYKLLKFQMGVDLQREIQLSQTLEDILSEIDKGELLTSGFDVTNHIDYRMLDTREKSLRLLVKKEKTEYLPTISAFFSHSLMAMRNSFNFLDKDQEWFPSTVVGLNINIPVFFSGQRGAKLAQAKMALEKAKNDRKQVEDGLQLELLRARSDFATALEGTQKTRDNVKLAKKIYDKTLVKYSNGTVSSLELTQVHNQYLTAESNYTRALVELLNAKTLLDKALNRL